MQLELARVFHRVPIAEKEKFETAFRDSDGHLWKFNRAGLGLTVLPAACTRTDKRTLGTIDPDVVSWIDDILISTYIF